MKLEPSERCRVCLGKTLSGRFPREVEREEYGRMAAVEDAMWYYRALHAHLERELEKFFCQPCRAGPPNPAVLVDPSGGVLRPRPTILDAGCGTGGLIRRLAPKHPDWAWTGIDFEPLACDLARARVGCNVEITEGSVVQLPFADNTFDAVVSADVLCNVTEDESALREFCRILRSNSVLIVNLPAHRWLWSYHDVTVHTVRRYVRTELREKLTAAGFSVVRLTHWNMLPLPLVWARRKLFPAPKSGSDVRLYPAPIEAGFRGAMALERAWLSAGATLPLGSSILAVARKPTKT